LLLNIILTFFIGRNEIILNVKSIFQISNKKLWIFWIYLKHLELSWVIKKFAKTSTVKCCNLSLCSQFSNLRTISVLIRFCLYCTIMPFSNKKDLVCAISWKCKFSPEDPFIAIKRFKANTLENPPPLRILLNVG
jgi:hypothetical protein